MTTMRRICGFCDEGAVWRWIEADTADHTLLLCDDHAAEIDLHELEDLQDPEAP